MLEIGILSSFIAGLLAFVSPCILPLVPVYIGMMSKKTLYRDKNIKLSERLYLFVNSLLFVLGFTIVFMILGSTATFLGRAMSNYSVIIGRIGGVILIIFGLHYMGLFKIRFLNFEKKFRMPDSLRSGYVSSFIFGVIFSFGWVPCVGLILSGILMLASKLDTILEGVLLLGVFSAGLGIPFILASIFISFFSKLLKRLNRHLNIVSIISGIFIVVLGIVFVTDSMIRIMSLLSRYVPVIDKINF